MFVLSSNHSDSFKALGMWTFSQSHFNSVFVVLCQCPLGIIAYPREVLGDENPHLPLPLGVNADHSGGLQMLFSLCGLPFRAKEYVKDKADLPTTHPERSRWRQTLMAWGWEHKTGRQKSRLSMAALPSNSQSLNPWTLLVWTVGNTRDLPTS